MRRPAVLLVLLALASAAGADPDPDNPDGLPVMSAENARNLGAVEGEYITPEALEARRQERMRRSGEQDESGGRKEGDENRQTRRPPSSRAPTRVAPSRSAGSPGASVPPAAPTPAAKPSTDNPGSAAAPGPGPGAPSPPGDAGPGSAPPPQAAGPRVTPNSTSRIGTRLEGMKSALGGLNADAGGPPGSGPAAPSPGERAQAPGAGLPESLSGTYASTLRDLGLRVGAGPDGRGAILESDGRPASASTLSALRARIAQEPRALMRRPDFFDRLPRPRYEQLKAAHASAPQRPQLRDISLGDGKDFTWSRSCDQVAGGCNDSAPQGYRRNDDVPPETLLDVWTRIQEEPGEGAESWKDYAQRRRAEAGAEAPGGGALPAGWSERLARRVVGSGRRIAELLGDAAVALGWAAPEAASRAAEASSAAGRAGVMPSSGSARRARRLSRQEDESWPEPPAARRPPWGRLLLALMGAFALFVGLRALRRREAERVRLAPLPRDEQP